MHVVVGPHGAAHAPQLSSSVSRSVSQSGDEVSQFPQPVWHAYVHALAVHEAIAFAWLGHARAHWPQFSGSLVRLVSQSGIDVSQFA